MNDCQEFICSQPTLINDLMGNKYFHFQNLSLFHRQQTPNTHCPLDKVSLGQSSWNLLHTMGVCYSITPTDQQKLKMKQFIEAFAEFYPCKGCRAHFQKDIEESKFGYHTHKLLDPPEVNSREEFSVWLCHRHNAVNLLLNNPQFDCSYANIRKRWLTGQEGCKTKQKFF